MKKFLLVLVGLIVVVIGAAIIVPFLVPTETYKQQLAEQLRIEAENEMLHWVNPPHLQVNSSNETL